MDIANFDALKAQGKILDLTDVNQDEDYLLIGKYSNKYNTDSFKYTKYPVWAIKAKDLIAVATDGVTVLGDGTPGNPLTTAAATAVQSVTGLDTDNTDPLNPVVNISVDGVTITGQGTPASPLIAVTSGSTFQYEIGQYVSSEGGVIAHRWLSTSAGGSPTAGTVQNYLVVDTQDLGASEWATINVDISNVESTFDGQTNTANLIVAGAGSGITPGTAAVLCDNSANNGKSDWYLPAIDELSKLWQNRWEVAQGINSVPGGTQLVYDVYWSSTESTVSRARYFDFSSGSASSNDKTNLYNVRAMRRFSI